MPHMADIATDVGSEGLAGLFEADAVKDQLPAVYEVGYHLLPQLSEGEVTAWTTEFSKLLSSLGATLVGEKAPEKIDLAYSIYRRVEGKYQGVNTAYFGWVAFELDPARITDVKKFMDAHRSVLRHIIVTTSRDEVKAVMEGKMLIPKAQSSTEAIAAPKRVEEQAGAVTDADIDKAIASIDEN